MKTVLVDLYKTGSYSGFGEICDNYGKLLAKADVPDIHFIFMVPKSRIGYYGDNVDYVAFETARKDLRSSRVHIDLWHSTDQLFKFRLRDKDIIRLVTFHDLNFIYEKKNIHKLKHYIKGWLKIRHSDWLVAISEFTRQDILRHYNVGNRPITLIRNGIREFENDPRRCPKFVHDGDKFFFTIGYMLRKKNFHTLIPMMKHFPDYKLFISGRPRKPYVNKVLSDIRRYNMNDRVFFTGPVTNEERNYLYANCQAFMFPSLWEGCGLPIVEAMRFKKPVFTSDSTCMPETGKDYVFYWNNFNPDYMADVVKKGLAEFDDKRAESEYEYSKTYSYEEYTKKYIALYRKILGLEK